MSLHDEYLELAKGDANFAAVKLAADLMRGDAAAYKQGYTRENAIIAASEIFPEVHREHLEQEVSDAE
jgi:hypothetical protein